MITMLLNLCEVYMYEDDPSTETEKKVLDFVNKLTQKQQSNPKLTGLMKNLTL